MNFEKLLGNPILCAFIVLVIGCGLYLTLNVVSWDFALPLRTRKLIADVLTVENMKTLYGVDVTVLMHKDKPIIVDVV